MKNTVCILLKISSQNCFRFCNASLTHRELKVIFLSFQWVRFGFLRTGTRHKLLVLERCSTPCGIRSSDHYCTQFARQLFWLSLARETVLGRGMNSREYLASRSGSRWLVYPHNTLQCYFPVSTMNGLPQKKRGKNFLENIGVII